MNDNIQSAEESPENVTPDRFAVLLWRCQEHPGGIDWINEAGKIIESRDAAQRQAGREEMQSTIDELDAEKEIQARRYDSLLELMDKREKRYAALETAARNNLRDIERLNEFAHRNGLPAFDLMEEETREALSDLDEAGKGEKNGR